MAPTALSPPGGPLSMLQRLDSIVSSGRNVENPRVADKLEHAPQHAQYFSLTCEETAISLSELFAENIAAKVYRTATRLLRPPASASMLGTPQGFPEIVPETGLGAGLYDAREPEFWTCGFFPGTLHALLERIVKYPQAMKGHGVSIPKFRSHLQSLCKAWSEPLHAMSSRKDTHDLGFIIMPALQRDWELNGNNRSLESIITAAHSLASRYIPSAGVIRSWDLLVKKEITVTDMQDNALVIIDSVCNLNLLFYAAAQSGETYLANIAKTHARTLINSHLRPEHVTDFASRQYKGQIFSTCHVANISPRNGQLKWQWTAQGYANGSTWARGQSWAILGYAQTYTFTKEEIFLEVACGVAEYFLYRLQTAPDCVEVPTTTNASPHTTSRLGHGRYVPLWDFDAPVDPINPLRDTSAGMIAANGMLIIAQALRGLGRDRLATYFQNSAIQTVYDTICTSLSEEKARLVQQDTTITVEDVIRSCTFEAILKHGTANNNENARRRYADHGLVYADYYFLEFGNRLISMGLI